MPDRHERERTQDRRLSVGLVVGSAGEAVHCGVRDYAGRLAQALEGAGVHARVLAPSRWDLRAGSAFLASLRRERFDVLHLQYPSIGHRHSLLPHVMGLAGLSARCFVTLHEHSMLPRAQRIANQLFRHTADRLVFTTAFEAEAFGAGAAACVIPIGSNIPSCRGEPPRSDTIVYFGQIRPGKGLEAFLTLAGRSHAFRFGTATCATRFLVVGSAPPRWRDYRDALRNTSQYVTWVDDVTPDQVAEILASARAAYLPFPDGVTYRRGSLLAALANGLPVIAPCGPETPAELADIVLPAQTPEDALEHVVTLCRDPASASRRGAAGHLLARRFTWPEIAAKHELLYRQAVQGRPAPRGSRPLPRIARTEGDLRG
jgi:glycosyltransferase involved in cell wall biosynthesis